MELHRYQVAGHGDLLSKDGLVYKRTSLQESLFYINGRIPWMPTYFGNEKGFLILEDLTNDFEFPCVIDIKMGPRLYDDQANKEKIYRMHELAQSTTSGCLGLRITGAKLFNGLDYTQFTKEQGKALTSSTFKCTLHKLIPSIESRNYFGAEVKRIHAYLSEMNCRFYSSSLLFTFDYNRHVEPKLRMIDFAHSNWNAITPDHLYLTSLLNLATLLE